MKTQVQKVKERLEAWANPIKARLEQPSAPSSGVAGVFYHDHDEEVPHEKGRTPGGRISSPFGARVHPIHKDVRMHKGVDIAAGKRPTYAVISGEVTYSGSAGTAGNMVTIYSKDSNGNEHKYIYMHLDSVSVKKGQKVKKGQQVGVMGDTGSTTGVHLHLEHRINDVAVPPSKEDIATAVPGAV